VSLRIAFILWSFPETSEAFILRQVVGLRDRGHVVHIYAHESTTGGPVHDEVFRYGLLEDVRYFHGRVKSSGPWQQGRLVARLLGNPVAALRCFRAIRRSGSRGLLSDLASSLEFMAEAGYDIVHCHYGDIGLKYGWTAAYWRAPLVVSFYGYDCSAYPQQFGKGVFAPLFRGGAMITVLGENMAAKLRMLGCSAEQLRRSRIGVDVQQFRCERSPSAQLDAPVRFLTVARLVEKKGIDIALRAVASVAEEFPDVTYDIVGDGPLRVRLESLTASLGLEGRVTFHDMQASAYVRSVMCRSDIFLLPSITTAEGDQEGTPTVLMEAACCGLPVVSTYHADIPEVVLDGRTGYLVPEGDVAALVERLLYMLRNRHEWSALGCEGRKHIAAEFNMEKLSQELEQMYLELLEARDARPRGDHRMLPVGSYV
jgi:colanic acid/amylovoran biosynthesis glycosyltransferase